MQKISFILIVFLLALLGPIGKSLLAGPAESFLRELPPGLFLKSSMEVPAEQTKAIGKKLGGNLERLTNSVLQVHGQLIQVNVLTAVDEANATAIYRNLSNIKSFPFSIQKGNLVVEYIGKELNFALAIKTSYELGMLPKPTMISYQVVAELSPVAKADYTASNLLFNYFITMRDPSNKASVREEAARQIHELVPKFKFGQCLMLRNPKLSAEPAKYEFKPPVVGLRETKATITYAFSQLLYLQKVPYVIAIMKINVDDTGFSQSSVAPLKTLTAATPFWPSDDPEIIALAQEITSGKTTHEAKAMAILHWLEPGRNLMYSGPVGSRWGVHQVLEQKFGRCWDFADCFVTLARAAGVPSREVAGWLYGSGGHVWTEFYQEGKGWQQVDPTGGGILKCGIYHIPYFTSEDGEMPIVYIGMPRIDAVPIK